MFVHNFNGKNGEIRGKFLRITPWKFIPNFLQLFHFFSKKLLGFRGKVGNLEVYFLKSHARFPCPVKE